MCRQQQHRALASYYQLIVSPKQFPVYNIYVWARHEQLNFQLCIVQINIQRSLVYTVRPRPKIMNQTVDEHSLAATAQRNKNFDRFHQRGSGYAFAGAPVCMSPPAGSAVVPASLVTSGSGPLVTSPFSEAAVPALSIDCLLSMPPDCLLSMPSNCFLSMPPVCFLSMPPDCLLSMPPDDFRSMLLIPEPDLIGSWLTASNKLGHSVISTPPLG